jgi:hypothetical protein
VHIAITGRTAQRNWVARVSEVEEVKTSSTDRVSARLGANSDTVVELLVHNHVVGTAEREKGLEVACEILGTIKGDGARRVDVEQLLHVEDLDAVITGLGADDHVVLVRSNLTPLRRQRVFGETAEVGHLAVRADLDEGSAVVLADGDELTTIIGGPTPGRGALTSRATKGGMAEEVVEIDL